MLEQDFSKVCARFEAAESELARFSGFSVYEQPAAINELRYAGHHILKAANSAKNEADKHDNLMRANGHCQRAVNDVRDEAIMVCLTTVRRFLDKQYTSKELLAIPGLMEVFKEVLQLRSALENSGLPSAITPNSPIEAALIRMCELHDDIKSAMAKLDDNRAIERKLRDDAEESYRLRVNAERMQKDKVEKRLNFLIFLFSFLLSAFSFTAIVVSFICKEQPQPAVQCQEVCDESRGT